MKTSSIILIITMLFALETIAQPVTQIPTSADSWQAVNLKASFQENLISIKDGKEGGILWLKDSKFKNGIIEFDAKGQDVRGESFVGMAFHGNDDKTLDCIYFRPFNFKSEQRKDHAVQYISLPGNHWNDLRSKFPGKYENEISPAPDPNDWFHAKIVVDYPSVKVYVNGSESSSLEIKQISIQQEGAIGIWVGAGPAWFKNLTVSK